MARDTIKPRLPEPGDVLAHIRRHSEVDGKMPSCVLVYAPSGQWHIYPLPGKNCREAGENDPLPSGIHHIDPVTGIYSNPDCYLIGGIWYWF